MEVFFKKKTPDVKLPSYSSDGASGMDVYAEETAVLWPHSPKLIKTGLFVEVPKGFEIQVRPRSGLALKSGITVLNTPGTIDSDYRGEIGVILYNATSVNQIVNFGDRIAQLVVCPIIKAEVVEVDELSNTARGEGGFGSTGK